MFFLSAYGMLPKWYRCTVNAFHAGSDRREP